MNIGHAKVMLAHLEKQERNARREAARRVRDEADPERVKRRNARREAARRVRDEADPERVKRRNAKREAARRVRDEADPERVKRRRAARRVRDEADPDRVKRRNAKREAARRVRDEADPERVKRREAARKARGRHQRNLRRFVGCDGEGMKDCDGCSRYVLFRMGACELHRGGERLTTPELLQFICDYPDPDAILVGFFFEYDISNILFDVPLSRDPSKPDIPSALERLLQVDLKAGAVDPYRFGGWTRLTFPGYPAFGVQYIPRNYIKVCRLAWRFDGTVKRWRNYAIPGSTRIIYDTQGFFQTSFLNALRLWDIGVEHHEAIAAMKSSRSRFAGVTEEIRRYCAIECDLLAQMMEAFREQCIASGMVPRTWNGAGKIATVLLREHGAMTAARVNAITPSGVLDLAHAAYYGGRFETTRVGRCPAIWEHDICSAYPAAMLALPCFEHGIWIEQTARQLDALDGGELFVAGLRFSHPREQFLCGFPFRAKEGRLSWPREGNGVYWSPEIRSAQRLGAEISCKGGWRFEPSCSCQPYRFVEYLYEQRLAIGKSVRGIPIKLGLSSIYGKRAQRIGKPVYANPIEAGLITALTRAKINDAINLSGDPRRVVMIATDGIYTADGPIAGLATGNGLGQWGIKEFASLFIVRPGLYWTPGHFANPIKKTKGLSPLFFEPLIPEFERVWGDWFGDLQPLMGKGLPAEFLPRPPWVPVPIETFVGVRLAMRLGDANVKCQWVKRDVRCQFSWSDKRGGARLFGECLMLGAKAGSGDAHSHHYTASGTLASSATLELDRMIFEAHPDYIDLGPPRLEQAL